MGTIPQRNADPAIRQGLEDEFLHMWFTLEILAMFRVKLLILSE